MVSAGWARSEKELKDGNAACVTAIELSGVTTTDEGSSTDDGSLWPTALVFLFVCLFVFSLLHHCPQPRFHKVAWLLVPGCRADGPQVQQVVAAAPSSSSHSCYLSLLTLVYLCQLRVPLQISLFHVGFDRWRRWSLRVSHSTFFSPRL